MELTLNKTELAGALPALGKLVSRTAPMDANRAVEITGFANTLHFRTRNFVEEIEFTMFAEMKEDFPATLVNFEQFRLAVRNCKNKTLKLECDCGEIFFDEVMMAPVKGHFPLKEHAPEHDATVTELPADTLSALSLLAPLTDKGADPRRVLGGINISRDGFTATDGKAIRGIYPNWKRVVPERTAATHYVSFLDDRAERLVRFLKSIPDDREHNNAVKLSRLPEVPDNLHLESSNGMLFSILAEFDNNWGDLSFTVRKEILLHLLNAGHRKIELNDAYGPIVGTGGTGQYIAMPIFTQMPQTHEQKNEQTTSSHADVQVAVQPEQTTPESIKQKPPTTNTDTTPSTKEKITMIDTNTIHTVSAPVQTSAPNHEPELNPLDELTATIEAMKAKLKAMFEESAAMSRKVREVALAQRQKEREYIQTKRTIERIRTASGF